MKTTFRRRGIVLAAALAVLLAALWGIFTLIAKHQSFVESYYQVQSDKLTSNVRVVQLSDLHLHEFGDHNSELIERITALKPDIIAITGDMNDKLVEHRQYIKDNGVDLPEVRAWKWNDGKGVEV